NQLNSLPRSKGDEARFAAMRARLLGERARRVRPSLDDKILADWNGLMIAALAHASTLIDEPEWSHLASQAFDFIAKAMTRGGRVGHAWRGNQLVYPGLASDSASMVRAALSLHEATGRPTYLAHAISWQSALERHYADAESGRYFLTADDAQGL